MPATSTPARCARAARTFIHHPWAVAVICAELKLDTATIAAALLHDVVEDTQPSWRTSASASATTSRLLVDGVTKLARISFPSREQAQVENYRKMILAMAQDLRVVADQARRPAAQHAHDRRPAASRSSCRRPARRSRSTRRWPTGWASTRSSGSSRTWPSQTLQPRRYAEIEAMVDQRRGDRERYVDEAVDDPPARAGRGRHRGRDLRPRQAPLLDLREDGPGRQGVQRDLRPDRHPRAGRLGQGLLRRDRHHPLAVEADAGPLQGLHRDAQARTCTSRCTRR